MNKILHLSPTDIRYDGRILKEIGSLQQQGGWQVMGVGIDDNEGQQYQVPLRDDLKIYRLSSRSWKILPRPVRYFLNLLEAMIRITPYAIRYRPALIHCHDTLFMPIALLARFFTGAKLIYDAHELESDKSGQSRLLSRFTLMIERVAWPRVDVFISVSPSIIDWYLRFFGSKKTELILNAPSFDRSVFEAQRNDYLRSHFGIPDTEKVFVYLGIITEHARSIPLYLDAFSRDQITAHIVFIGYGEYVDRVKEYAGRFGNIHYHDAVPFDQIVHIVKSADVGLCMIEAVSQSTYYSLPNKLFEYAFAGLYLLTSDFPDMKKIVEDYQLGEYCSLEPAIFVAKIKDLQNKEIRKSQVDLYPLTWEYQARKLCAVYDQILKG